MEATTTLLKPPSEQHFGSRVELFDVFSRTGTFAYSAVREEALIFLVSKGCGKNSAFRGIVAAAIVAIDEQFMHVVLPQSSTSG
ncbi:hypothetical protein [Brucella pituitosa]|uniref:hypothetical protein n=1 Tax=Brucella pituitosa TaxID=571256 RepID=UPI00142E5F24|nr:hypothetical protein [Brucella pituitosa]